ncbi:MAG: V4R domain-containing protein [Syntrophomonadaceae bacterium]|jgi:predicted hydrocarbon binding protein
MGRDNFSFKILNNMFLGVGQLADKVPMGGKNYLEMVCDFYVGRMFNEYKDSFNPASDKAIDLCRAWIELMEKEGYLDKNDYELSNGGDFVTVKVSKHNCSYFEYCTTANRENIAHVCPRILGLRWVVANCTGRQYQLKTEEFSDTERCLGTIYPGEVMSEILTKDGDNISIAGERAIVLTTNAYGILMKTIYEYAPHLLERVLYESTYYSSLVEYDRIAVYYQDARQIVEHLLRTIERLGNIRYEIVSYDDKNKQAIVRGYGSYMAEIFKENHLFSTPKMSCASGKGRLAAYFTKAWGEEIICEELSCEAFGDDYCEFILLPKNL